MVVGTILAAGSVPIKILDEQQHVGVTHDAVTPLRRSQHVPTCIPHSIDGCYLHIGIMVQWHSALPVRTAYMCILGHMAAFIIIY